jgi:hypothetical protein
VLGYVWIRIMARASVRIRVKIRFQFTDRKIFRVMAMV